MTAAAGRCCRRHEREPDRLDAADLSLMVAVAGQVAASLRGVELRTESERRARRLALTAQIARSIAAAASVDEALETPPPPSSTPPTTRRCR